jgi:26S proteasome regulatory subunit T6
MNLTRGIDLKKIADKMSGASGAELKACCTEAGMFALRERRVHVTQVRSWRGGGGGGPRPRAAL